MMKLLNRYNAAMTQQDYLKIAVQKAKDSVTAGGFPAGAIVVKNDAIVSEGISIGYLLHDPTAHAESVSVRAACKALQTSDLSGATLYASLQPCTMCFSAAVWANISTIVFGCKKTTEMVEKRYYEGKTDVHKINDENTHTINLIYLPDFEKEMLSLIAEWEKKYE